ncbi:MAG: transposase [Candidatus Moeniiplasma glomeromycotorum]|nr:transposase [Candidatus Moeniiplasma glomeromycotorum]MCE8167013.1 transposase [Candidatus Moeniiplasma glomeromycotorum]MCE8168975.1 transposase [Candidatus Moeniiplasma glomeromycotorum]
MLDNARIHYITKQLEELARQKNIILVYLPRYSPELNPVEEIFNVIKGYIRKFKPRTEEELRTAIEKMIDILNQQGFTSYFKDCFNYSDKAKKKEKDWINKKRASWWAWMGKIENPQNSSLFSNAPIYPSWGWMKLGSNPSLNKLRLAKKRIGVCFEESLKLSYEKKRTKLLVL